MTKLNDGYRGLSLLFKLNWDLIRCSVMIFGALMAGSYLASPI